MKSSHNRVNSVISGRSLRYSNKLKLRFGVVISKEVVKDLKFTTCRLRHYL